MVPWVISTHMLAALPNIDWAALQRRLRQIPGARIECLHHTDRTARLDRRILSRADAYQHGAARFRARHVELYSLGYFTQRLIEGEVGSSTMPHKINPIDFENAEGNLGVANALLGHFATSCPCRDCSATSPIHGASQPRRRHRPCHARLWVSESRLESSELDTRRLAEDLERAWEVLGEAVQTVMRSHGSRTPMIASSDLPAAGH